MGFLKKMSASDHRKAYKEGGCREREILDTQFARVPVKGNKDAIAIHGYQKDYKGEAFHVKAIYDKKRGRWIG